VVTQQKLIATSIFPSAALSFAYLDKPNFARSGLAERKIGAAIVGITSVALLFAYLDKPNFTRSGLAEGQT
jgi:hypothetical protein